MARAQTSARLVFPVHVVVGSDDPSDAALAEHLRSQIAAFADTRVVPLDEIASRDTAKSYRVRPIAAITVLILSGSTLKAGARAEAMAHVLGAQYRMYLRHYCLARDLSPDTLRQAPQSIAGLLECVHAFPESEEAALLQDLRWYVIEHLPTQPQLRHPSLFFADGLWVATGVAAMLVLILLRRVTKLGLLAAVALAGFWVAGWCPSWAAVPAAFSLFAAGEGFGTPPPGEMWPWLERGWRLPPAADRFFSPALAARFSAGWLVLWIILALLVLGVMPLRTRWIVPVVVGTTLVQCAVDLICVRFLRAEAVAATRPARNAVEMVTSRGGTPEFVPASAFTAAVLRRWSSNLTLRGQYWVGFFFLSLPALSAARHADAATGHWLLLPFIAGLFGPAVLQAIFGKTHAMIARRNGLTHDHFSKTTAVRVTATTREVRLAAGQETTVKPFPTEQLPRAVAVLDLLSGFSGRRRIRPWLTPHDRVFISYSWRDLASVDTAKRIADACRALGVHCFLDRADNDHAASLYLRPVSHACATCTHCVLVVSESLLRGNVVDKEIRTTVDRWTLEFSPAVICVAPAGVSASLRAAAEVPVELRALLCFCPEALPQEATEPALLRYLLAFTRKHGRVQDLLHVLSPASSSARALRVGALVG